MTGRMMEQKARQMILYGIPTCDTCKEGLEGLEAAGHEVSFRDIARTR